MLFENERISIGAYMICNGVNPILNILQTNKILLAPPSFSPRFGPPAVNFKGCKRYFIGLCWLKVSRLKSLNKRINQTWGL